jgi:anti-sigma factor RsiW
MNEATELTCRELVELVTEYLEGTLTPPDRMRFEEHIAVCEGCSTYVDQMRKTIELTGALTEESLSAAAKRSLLEAFRQWRRGPGAAGG